MLTDDFFLSCQVLSLSAALLVSGKKIQFQGGGSEAGGEQPRGSPYDVEQPCQQRPALGPMQLLDSRVAHADSSLVSKGFSSPPPLTKIPQLVLEVVSLAYCEEKKKQGKREKKFCMELRL